MVSAKETKTTVLEALTHEWGKLLPKIPDAPNAEGIYQLKHRLRTLLRKCIQAGTEIAEPAARSRLQHLAREIGDALFRFSNKYPDTVISPPREAVVQKVKGPTLKVEGLSNLPAAGDRFFGREEVLAILDDAWKTETPEEKMDIHLSCCLGRRRQVGTRQPLVTEDGGSPLPWRSTPILLVICRRGRWSGSNGGELLKCCIYVLWRVYAHYGVPRRKRWKASWFGAWRKNSLNSRQLGGSPVTSGRSPEGHRCSSAVGRTRR